MAGACARDFSEGDDYMLPRPQAPCAFQKVGVLSELLLTRARAASGQDSHGLWPGL